MKVWAACASPAVRQYLERYAAPEAAIGHDVARRYHSVLVVPAFRESPDVLDRFRTAVRAAPGDVLIVLVVNAAAPVAGAAWPEHRELLASVRGGPASRQLSSAPSVWLSRRDDCDVLSVDRASPGACLPAGEGVGLARRIGSDIALGLWALGRLEVPFVYCTDADAELPAEYFRAVPLQAPEGVAAAIFEFWHAASGDVAIDAATAVYELGLRYYVAGLAAAGSPYAYHSIGSALAVEASVYAAVRGFPRRLSGEDFYLLNKVAKVGSIWRVDEHPLRLESRASLRTVHGTGTSAVKLATSTGAEGATFYHPEVFAALATWLESLGVFAATRDLRRARSVLESSRHGEPLIAALAAQDAFAALEEASRRTRSRTALCRRLHEWFDAFRTLKLVHALRASAFPSLPFRMAVGEAPFAPPDAREAGALAIDELRQRFLAAERRRVKVLGAPAMDSCAEAERLS